MDTATDGRTDGRGERETERTFLFKERTYTLQVHRTHVSARTVCNVGGFCETPVPWVFSSMTTGLCENACARSRETCTCLDRMSTEPNDTLLLLPAVFPYELYTLEISLKNRTYTLKPSVKRPMTRS